MIFRAFEKAAVHAVKNFLAALTGWLVAMQPAGALQLTDDRGAIVTLTQAPRRIVSLLPSLTESICALEQCQRLVGVDNHSNFPLSVRRLPIVGSGLDPNIEAIVALRPDVVLIAVSSRASQRLEGLGIKVIALEPKSHDDVKIVLQKLGVLLGIAAADGADRLWRIINAGISAAAQSVPPKLRSTRVYMEVAHGPYAAGEASFIGETLMRLGVKNVVPADLGPFPRLNPEFVVRANPDLIMTSSRVLPAMLSYPGWFAIRAVREKRICIFTPDETDVVVRAGPRIADAARIIAACIANKAR